MKKFMQIACSAILMSALSQASLAAAGTYAIDTKGAHAFVQFRYKHLGYSWLYGRFNKFDGEFTYDPKDDSKNSVTVTVDVTSVDSNHAERDKHFRSGKYLNTDKHSQAKFVSTKYKSLGDNKATLTGNLTLMGVTKPVTLDVDVIGGGDDPWGGVRQGFEGRTTINPADFGMKADIGKVELVWSVEGILK
ncbi:YceI family protein [Agarilytica rhodophyticola]|uniref:YceI family protein n=1 Tax=Agarilytica rhodophyticola TaxID=1737490 RepID=UPI000B349B01